MSYSFREACELLPDCQVSGGAVVIHRDGKHIAVGTINSYTSAFELTPAGKSILDDCAVVSDVPAVRPRRGVLRKRAESGLPEMDELLSITGDG